MSMPININNSNVIRDIKVCENYNSSHGISGLEVFVFVKFWGTKDLNDICIWVYYTYTKKGKTVKVASHSPYRFLCLSEANRDLVELSMF